MLLTITEWVKLARAIPFQTYLAEVFLPERFKGYTEYKDEIARDAQAFGWSYLREKNKRDNALTLRQVKDLQKILENVSPMRLSHYYLPGKAERTQGFLVDFSYISSVPYEELIKRTLLLRLKSPWREQLLNRYVSFSLRIGTEDYSKESICETIQAFFSELSTEQVLKKMK